MLDYAVVVSISMAVSFVSGLIGLGGAVLLIPAYYFLPQLLGAGPLDIRLISGMTSIQVFAGAITSVIVHGRKGAVNRSMVLTLAVPMVICSLAGALLSGDIARETIVAVFAVLAIIGAALLVLRAPVADTEPVSVADVTFNQPVGLVSAVLIGFFGGMVGAPGSFLISPVMIAILKIPTRIAIGSTLGIVIFTSLATGIGKFATGQIPYLLTLAAVAGAIPGSIAGSRISHRIDVGNLRRILALFIALAGIAMGAEALL